MPPYSFFFLPFPLPTVGKIASGDDGNVTCASVDPLSFCYRFFRILAVLSGSVFHLVVSCRFSCRFSCRWFFGWFFVSVSQVSSVESIKAVSLCSTYRWKTIGMCSRGSLTRLCKDVWLGKYGKRVYRCAYVMWEKYEKRNFLIW